MRTTWIGIGAAVALVAAAAPGTASASKRIIRTADMKLEATDGYKGYVFATHQLKPRRHAELSVSVYKDGAYAYYEVPALFTKRHLEANLGQFGRVNVRIHKKRGHRAVSGTEARRLRTAAPEVLSGQPEAKAAKRERAVVCFIDGFFHRKAFLGRIRFEAESGYTGIHANRATGTFYEGNADCPRGSRAHGTFLTAKSGPLEFYASRVRAHPHGYTVLYASQEETSGRVTIERSAANYRGAVFDFSPDFMTAHVEPSAGPLSGSADFASPDQWTGDLTASFPGEPDVPLTGPGFKAHLKHF